MKKGKKLVLTAKTADRHVLYENAVQGVDSVLDTMSRVYRRTNQRLPRVLREDFCGTALMAAAWVERSKQNRAIGVDLDRATLDWGIAHHVPCLDKSAAGRLQLLCEDVLTVKTRPADLIGAFNFSFNVFKERDVLLAYFRAAHAALARGGIFWLDEFCGPESHTDTVDKKKVVDGVTPDGRKLEKFTYLWEQKNYNPLTSEATCSIHFRFKDGTRMQNAFVYDWRIWTLPELADLLRDAGFSRTEFYMQGWDDEQDDVDGIFRKRARIEVWDSWYGYVAGFK